MADDDRPMSSDVPSPGRPTLREAMESAQRLLLEGKPAQAQEICLQVLRDMPDQVVAMHCLAMAIFQQGRYDEAVERLRRVLELKPDYFGARYNLGRVLYAAGRREEAMEALRLAVKLRPDLPDAYIVLGAALMDLNLADEAVVTCRKVVKLRPDVAMWRCNLGNALLKRFRLGPSGNPEEDVGSVEDLDEAAEAFEKSLQLDPNYAQAYLGLGEAARERGQLERAMACYDRALAIEPQLSEANFNKAVFLLRQGDFQAGWARYEWRWKCPGFMKAMPQISQPRWQGEELEGRRILLFCEQGFGDAIQFVRYAPLVADRGGHVILACPEQLTRLFRTMRGVHELTPRESQLPPFDVHCPLMSLPHVLGTTLESIPAEVPYLHPVASDIDAWRRRVSERPGLRVGVVWAGASFFKDDRRRSCPLEALEPLLETPGASFFSLQIGPRSADLARLGGRIVDLSPHLGDFADTAAAISQLDLVISVDTAVVHLAGALAKPVWVLLRFQNEWRWLTNRQDSPWYPTARLFRQDKPGDWPGAVEQVIRALRQFSFNRLT